MFFVFMMDFENFVLKLKDSLIRNHTTIFSARCVINYSGRAESHLQEGDRIIIIKSDKTLLVHQPNGSTPVNYMKENTNHEVIRDDKSVIIESRNLQSKDFLRIIIVKPYYLHSQILEDGEKIILVGSEKDMAQHIMENPELIEKHFKPVSVEEHTKYGFIDVLGHDKNNTLVVVECKRYTGNLSAVTQLRRYVEKIKETKGLKKVRGILACPKISPNALKMLQDWKFTHAPINPPKYLERYDKNQQKLTF